MTHRDHLPQLDGDLFVTDGGIETTLIFHDGLDLPLFAAFDLLKDDEGTEALRRYFEPYAEDRRRERDRLRPREPDLAREPEVGSRARLLGRGARRPQPQGDRADGGDPRAVRVARDARSSSAAASGRRTTATARSRMLSADEAEDYHSTQIGTFADTAADMVTAITMTYSDEAIGVTRAARRPGCPSAIHFTVETDGRLPSEEPLGDAIAAVVDATDDGPAYFGINCAHPTHFDDVLERPASGASGSGACGRTRRPRATPSWTRRPSSTPATRTIWAARYAGLRDAPAQPERGRRLLRHRPPPRRGDRQGDAALELHRRRARRALGGLVARHRLCLGDERPAAGELDVEGRPDEERQVRDPHPDQEDDHAGDRAVGARVRAEVGDVEGEAARRQAATGAWRGRRLARARDTGGRRSAPRGGGSRRGSRPPPRAPAT